MEKDSPEHIRILIVSHTFPPAPGIGGRRWAKFAKYLQRNGHLVEVLTAAKPEGSKSSWTTDVEGIPIHTYAHYFPEALEKKPKGLFEKIAYRIALYGMNRKSNGSPYDRALCDEKAYVKELLQLLDFQEFHCVIVTGAPFRLLSYTANLIPRFPEIVFMADFRDPWTWGEAYGYKHLPLERLRFEKDSEKKVVDAFRLVSSPWPEIVRKLQRKYPKNAEKIFEISHGFDPDDFPVTPEKDKVKSDKLKLVYGGSLYKDSRDSIAELIDFVNKNSSRYELDIYSHDAWGSDQKSVAVHFHKPVSSKEFFAIAQRANRLVFFIPEHAKNGIPSKLYELAALRLPILAMGRKGTLSAFIENKNIGRFLAEDGSLETFFAQAMEIDTHGAWLDDYSIEAISRKFVERIKIEVNAREEY